MKTILKILKNLGLIDLVKVFDFSFYFQKFGENTSFMYGFFALYIIFEARLLWIYVTMPGSSEIKIIPIIQS